MRVTGRTRQVSQRAARTAFYTITSGSDVPIKTLSTRRLARLLYLSDAFWCEPPTVTSSRYTAGDAHDRGTSAGVARTAADDWSHHTKYRLAGTRSAAAATAVKNSDL